MGSIPSDDLSHDLLNFAICENYGIKRQIDSYSKLVARYCSDLIAIQDAKELVPVAQIVQDNLDILEGDYKDNFLPHLVKWYSYEFFSWFDAPDCEKCESQLEIHGCSINLEGNNVENYRCNNATCDYSYDFIRHNDPAILIRTRKGRCGEKANCFMLFLIAFEYEARIVLDTTDHVWNEVWSESQKRWLHIDTCEATMDMPLLYELGWNKKLEYCLAFSQYEVSDVTRRYSAHYDDTKLKRKSCSERWLELYLGQLTSKLLSEFPGVIKDGVIERITIDKKHLNEISTRSRSLPEGVAKLKGRGTGSISWRIARGEFNPISKNLIVIKMINNCDMDSVRREGGKCFFELRYNSLRDIYESSSEEYKKKGWSSLTYMSENLDYKYERDWKTSYVARYESCPREKTGKLQWRFDLSNLDPAWSRIEILVNGMIYPATTIDLLLKCYSKSTADKPSSNDIILDLDTINIVAREQLGPELCIIDLIIELSGGGPDDIVAWQKPQLFRQVRGQSDNEWPFTLRVA